MEQQHEITPNSAFPRTKNGRLAACEPCQKRKYACDRSLPTCLRCQRSRVKKPCRYTAASSQHAQTSSYLSNYSQIARSTFPQNDSTEDLSHPSTISDAIELGSAAPTLNPHESVPANLSSPAHGRSSSVSVDINDLQVALDALSSLPSLEAEHILAKSHINVFNGWISFSTTQVLSELRSSYPSAFREDQQRERLTELALTIFSNTADALSNDQDYLSVDWYSSFSGTRIRWEIIGLLFSSWALYALQNKVHISQYRPRVLVVKFFDIMQSCIRFCHLAKASNLFLLYLVYRTSIVSSILDGPGNANFWKLHTETVSLACSLRLHAMPDSSLEDVDTKKQSERRLFAAIYILDKSAAIFMGKIPLLTSQYCSTALPLDIFNTVLLHKKPALAANLLSLGIDSDGWNISGEIYCTTTLRARGLIAHLREEIMVLALNNKRRVLPDLIKLKMKQVRTFSQLPSWLQLSNDDEKSKSPDPCILYTKLFIRLEHLQNLFVIERLLHDIQLKVSQNDLVNVCLDVISVTVAFWTRNDCLVGMEGDYEWFIIGYAVPAAVTLCKTLLLAHDKSSSTSSTPTSAIIQQLSLLNAFIEWLMLRAPCSSQCSKTKNLIARVLDQVLNNSSYTTTDIVQDTRSQRSASRMVHTYDLNEIDTFNWLQ
ncbi:hypothetical protein ACQKWADRAFT_322217 [Trichoderma austrokoningii]